MCGCACYIVRTIDTMIRNVLYQVRTFLILTSPSEKVSGDSAADYS